MRAIAAITMGNNQVNAEHYWDKIKYLKCKTTDGSEVSHKTCSFEAKLKDGDVPIKFVVILGTWNIVLHVFFDWSIDYPAFVNITHPVWP